MLCWQGQWRSRHCFTFLEKMTSGTTFIGLMLKLKSNTLATWCKEMTHLKRPWCWERLKSRGEGDNREWNGWMASLTQWIWVEQTPRIGDGQGGLVCCSPWGHKELDTTEQLNWTEPWRCDHSPRARHPVVWSQVGLRKYHYNKS